MSTEWLALASRDERHCVRARVQCFSCLHYMPEPAFIASRTPRHFLSYLSLARAERAPFRLNFYPSILTNLISGIPGFTVGRPTQRLGHSQKCCPVRLKRCWSLLKRRIYHQVKYRCLNINTCIVAAIFVSWPSSLYHVSLIMTRSGAMEVYGSHAVCLLQLFLIARWNISTQTTHAGRNWYLLRFEWIKNF